ncbi:hypothetical protein TKK_0003486 [Trichogramma kaykai]|uniref:BEN domain-containing protein n=1 Tax=Trichogramma kaykai TaxID=54128 RepID=A0ABD2XR51_9HYME
MQYLVECNDKIGSLCIIYQHDMIITSNKVSLDVGSSVNFKWTEPGKKTKKFTGTILSQSRNENDLMKLMETLIKSKEKSNKNNSKATLQVKSKKNPPRTLEKEIMNDLLKQDNNEMKWVVDECEEIKKDITNKLATFQKQILDKIEFLQSTFSSNPVNYKESVESLEPSNSINNNLSKETSIPKKRRSYGMNLEEKTEGKPNECVESLVPSDSINNLSKETSIPKKRRSYGMDFEEKIEGKPDEFEKIEFHNLENELTDDMVLSEVQQDNFLESNGKTGQESEQELMLSPQNSDMILDEFSFDVNNNTKLKTACEQKKILSNQQPNYNQCKPSTSTAIREGTSDNPKLKIDNEQKFFSNQQANEYKSFDSTRKQERKRIRVISSDSDDDDNVVDNYSGIKSLKYTEAGENVTELVKGTGIYVNTLDVSTAMEISTGQNELARGLMKAVFTEAALSKCSLMGTKGERPGLYKPGVDTILLYVKNYAAKLNWPRKDRQLIVRSMSAKLQEMKK